MTTDTPQRQVPVRRGRAATIWLLAIVFAAGAVAAALLTRNIATRKVEARQMVFDIVKLSDDVTDPAEWGKNFPYQYDSYKRTVDTERTRHGGSEAFQKLDADPRLRAMWDGYPFAVDFREERGHAYMLADQRETERVKMFKQPGACLHCHASVTKAYFDAGVAAGAPKDDFHGAIEKGWELVNAIPYGEATKLVEHPVSCVDCHEAGSMKLRITRPGFLEGIRNLAASDDPVPHLPSVERWRQGSKKTAYDPNALASRQELRSMACAQCHVEYYFKGDQKRLTYPWHNGLKVEQIEAYYDKVGHKDWVHKVSGAPALKAQHPEFELWSQGVHARSGVSCADCHMPYQRVGAVKVSDHHVRSPMLNIARACQTCHPSQTEDQLKERVATTQDRTRKLMDRAEDAIVELIGTIESAKAAGGER